MADVFLADRPGGGCWDDVWREPRSGYCQLLNLSRSEPSKHEVPAKGAL